MIRPKRHRPANSSNRRGIALIAVIILLMVAGLVVTALLQQTYQVMAQQKITEWQIQTDCLLDSGRELAWSRLGTNPDYKGETWTIPASRLASKGEGKIQIRVEPTPSENNQPPSSHTISITAEFPLNHTHQVRRTADFRFPIATSTNNTPSQPTGEPRP